jgi:hypothetical protein
MLLREDQRGILAIGQPSHAWLSGQLARAWGNEQFGTVVPFEEVCLAAEQHDVGFGAWDLEPLHNPHTELPYSFIEMPISEHLKVWRAGPGRLITQSRYAALLVSMHGERLYRRRDLDRLEQRDADDVRGYLEEQQALQRELRDSLHADPGARRYASEELIARNSQLVWTWDFISLVLCLDWDRRTARDVPTADGAVDMEIGDATIDPWPFAAEKINLRCEGRRLEPGQALSEAPWETLSYELRALSPS